MWSVFSLFLCHVYPIPPLVLGFFQVNIEMWDKRKCGKIIGLAKSLYSFFIK